MIFSIRKKAVTTFSLILIAFLMVSALAGCSQPTQTAQTTTQAAQTTTQAAQTTQSEQTTEITQTEAPVGAASNFNDGREINVVSREEGSGTRGAFIELLGIQVRGDDGTTKDMTTGEAIIADGTSIVMTNVANDLYAIGYISMGSLNDTVKAIDIDGAAPTLENVKNKTYAIQRPFFIATKGDPSGVAKDFMDFILSKDGQEVIVGKGCIAVDDNAPAFETTKPSGKITVGGSSSVFPVMEKLVEEYNKINSNAEIELHQSDSSIGMQSTIEGSYDIGMSSRELKDTESEQLKGVQIAIDGLAVIVNPQNPITGTSKETICKIFIGELFTWDKVK